MIRMASAMLSSFALPFRGISPRNFRPLSLPARREYTRALFIAAQLFLALALDLLLTSCCEREYPAPGCGRQKFTMGLRRRLLFGSGSVLRRGRQCRVKPAK